MTHMHFFRIRRLTGLLAVTVLIALEPATAMAQEERQSLRGRSLEKRPNEPMRPSAEAQEEMAGALERALVRSDYGRKRLAIGLQDVGDSAFAGFKMERSEEEWRRLLTPAQFSVVHDKAAEPAAETFQVAESGVYACTCGQPLFEASAATGAQGTLAHFHRPVESAAVVTDVASAWSLDEEKVEVRCSLCGAHLGHVDSGQSAEDPLIFKLKPTALVWAGTAE